MVNKKLKFLIFWVTILILDIISNFMFGKQLVSFAELYIIPCLMTIAFCPENK
jgi:hypothetical protein